MTLKSKFVASGLWLYPLSLVAVYIAMNFLSFGRRLTIPGHLLAWMFALIPSMIILIQNLIRYRFENKRDFNFIDIVIDKAHPVSAEKLACMYAPVADKFKFSCPDGFMIGKQGGSYVRIPLTGDETRFGIIAGEPGTGKSAALVIPTLLANYCDVGDNIPSFVVDIKPELAIKSVNIRGDKTIRIVNPTDRSSWGWDVYHDIDENSTDDEIALKMTALSQALIVSNNNMDVYFVNQARDAFCGMMMFYFREGYGFIDSINKMLSCNPVEEIPFIISVTGKNKRVYKYLKRFEGDDTNGMKDAFSTMREHMSVFLFNDVQWALRDNPRKCNPEDLNEGNTIFLSIPETLLEEYKDLFRLIMAQTLKAMESRPEGADPVLFIFDEFGRVGKIERIKHSLATLRSKNCHIYMAFQNMSQIEDVYGENVAEEIMGMCRVKIFTSASDIKTIRKIKELSGSFKQEKKTYRNKGIFGLTDDGDSYTSETVNVLETEDITNLVARNELIAFIDNQYSRIKKNPYFKDPALLEIHNDVKEKNLMFKEA